MVEVENSDNLEQNITLIRLKITGNLAQPTLQMQVFTVDNSGNETAKSLPDKDIIALLMLNMTVEELMKAKLDRLASQQIEELVDIYTAKYIEEKANLNTFQIKTGISELIDTGKLETLRVTAGKYLLPQLFLKVSGDVLNINEGLLWEPLLLY